MDEPGTACQGLMKGGGVGGGFSIACAEGIDDGEGPEFEIDESMGLALISCCGVFETTAFAGFDTAMMEFRLWTNAEPSSELCSAGGSTGVLEDRMIGLVETLGVVSARGTTTIGPGQDICSDPDRVLSSFGSLIEAVGDRIAVPADDFAEVPNPISGAFFDIALEVTFPDFTAWVEEVVSDLKFIWGVGAKGKYPAAGCGNSSIVVSESGISAAIVGEEGMVYSTGSLVSAVILLRATHMFCSNFLFVVGAALAARLSL
jgi:hypothetical protein